MHSLFTENFGNSSATSQYTSNTSNNLKRTPDRDNDVFQLPPKRNTVKPPMFTFSNSVSTTNIFAQLESFPIPDPPTPQNTPIRVRQSDNIKTINESFLEIKITLSGEFLKIYSKVSDEHRKITQFLKNSKMDFFLITPAMKGPLKQLLKDFPTPLSTEIEQELSAFKFTNPNDLNKLLSLSFSNRRPGATQCYSCNRFHHNSADCFSTPRCLKCGEALPLKTAQSGKKN
ncbi:hypothetical protein CEXT_393271 [Caerostris extrusa]|uniref:Nucleic-acid-binding protein from transposon X-element n=1 Tax=Caerostris extrusa TaxID=172846 RepID=A0AAV4NAP4_CAEEX|nr:hypothetical protein CEXT_393271 [Caerostris extrusa]